MEARLDSLASKEVIGGLETNFTIPKTGSADTGQMPTNEQVEVLSILGSKSSQTTSGQFSLYKDGEAKTMTKSVSFGVTDQEEIIEEEADASSKQSIVSYRNLTTDNKVLKNRTSISTINSLKNSTTTSRMNMPVLEDIPEVDENVSEVEKAPGYYGWDGYETRFAESMADNESWSSIIPECVPLWAKSLRNKYGLSPIKSLDEDEVAESRRTMHEKLETLMKKHKDLMLLKRVESKKQLVVAPNKDPNELDTVQMKAKSTRYYMTPVTFDGSKQSTDDQVGEKETVSLPSLSDSKSLSITKKTSRPQAKREISQVLRSLQNRESKTKYPLKDAEHKVKKENDKCLKITLSNIREFVNMSPDERKLHEIIKIEKVPSVQDLKERGKPSSKYIINVPKNTITDKPTVNVIKIKEKRKLRVNSIENIEEKVTELHYNQSGTRRHIRRESDHVNRESYDIEPSRQIKTRTKSPTETKMFQVKTRQTPLLAPLINEKDKKTEKVLLLQYDKKSKKDKRTTQLVGIKEPSTSDPGEMYLYGAETEGKRVNENLTTVKDIPLTLKDKVHSIFEELRGLTLKQNIPGDMTTSEVQVRPSIDTKLTQRPSHFPATDEAMIEAKPDVRSTSVQVRQSQILQGYSDSFLPVTPHTTPTPSFQSQEEIPTIVSKETILTKMEDLVVDEDPFEKPLSDDEARKDERGIEQEPSKETQKAIKEDTPKTDAIDGEENKSEIIKSKEPADETKKDEEIASILDGETKADQSDVAEIPETSTDKDLKEKEIISEDDIKEKTEPTQDTQDMQDTHSKLSKEKSTESTEQLKEENQILSAKEEPRKLSKTSSSKDNTRKLSKSVSKVSGNKSSLPLSQGKDVKELPTVPSDERKMSQNIPDTDEELDKFLKGSFPKEFEDIRSYEIGSHQGTELVITSSSKFLHQKDGLRKKMNWTNDTIFLENNTCPQLMRGLAETAMRRPADPIAFLAHWIYKDCENRERAELEDVRHEHLELARAMAEVAGGDAQERKKFNVKKYPIHVVEEESQSKVFEEGGEFLEDNLEQPNEITQEV